MSLPPDAIPETPEETIERLMKSNNRLAQMVKSGSDRLAESARELMAQGWDTGFESMRTFYTTDHLKRRIPKNPYRQPINLPGATE